MVFHLITTDKQTIIRYSDLFHGGSRNQRAIKQRGDARQKLAVQLIRAPTPNQALPQREGQELRIVDITHDWADLVQSVGFGHGIQLVQHVFIGGAAVVVGTPNGIRAQRQGREKTISETTGTTEVRVAW